MWPPNEGDNEDWGVGDSFEEFESIVGQPELAELGQLGALDPWVIVRVPFDVAVEAITAQDHVSDHSCGGATLYLAALFATLMSHIREQVEAIDEVELDQLFGIKEDDDEC